MLLDQTINNLVLIILILKTLCDGEIFSRILFIEISAKTRYFAEQREIMQFFTRNSLQFFNFDFQSGAHD